MSKPQRRKGNAKAASSSHAAELLASYGGSTTIGFDGGFVNVFEAASIAADEYQTLDSDVVLVLKKLSKKDPKTREKALRELQELFLIKDIDIVDSSFGHLSTIQDKLLTDGSPTVRHLCCRVISCAVQKLKKLSEKHLKKVIPYLLLASCDNSNAVRSAVESFMGECMPGDKQDKITSIFAVETSVIALDIICNKSALCQPQKYDDEETLEQRTSRLTSQCLMVLTKLVTTNANPKLIETIQNQLFNNIAAMKQLLKSCAPIQSALLNLAMQCPNFSDFVVNSPLSSFVVSNLGSVDSSVSNAAFNAFLKLSDSEDFFKKIDLKKTIIPKLLSLMRNKSSHWSHMAQYLLNIFSIVLDRLPTEEQVQYAHVLLDAFSDGLPFEQNFLFSTWAKAFIECAKFTVCRLSSTVLPRILAQYLHLLDFVFTEPSETNYEMVSFLNWLADKLYLIDQVFLKSLELNVINKLPASHRFACLLLSSCKDSFSDFHSRLLRLRPLDIDFVQPLTTCSENYFQVVNKNVDLLLLLTRPENEYSDANSLTAAEVILRKVSLSDGDDILKIFQTVIKSDSLNRHVVSLAAKNGSSEIWQHLTDIHGGKIDFADKYVASFVNYWMVNNDASSASSVVDRFGTEFNEQLLSSSLIEKQIDASTWLDFLKDTKVSCECKKAISCLLLTNLLAHCPENDSLWDYLAVNVPDNLHAYVPDLLRSEDHNDIQRLCSVVAALIDRNQKYEELLISLDHLEQLITVYDNNVAAFEVPYLFGFGFNFMSSGYMADPMLLNVELEIYGKLAYLISKINLSCLTETYHLRCSCFLLLVDVIHKINRDKAVYQLAAMDDYNFNMKCCISRKSAMTQLLTMKPSPIVVAAMRYLIEDSTEIADLPSTSQALDVLAALRLPYHPFLASSLPPTDPRTGSPQDSFSSAELFVMKYHKEYFSKPLEFLDILREFINVNQTSWETELFDISSDDSLLPLSCVWMQAAKHHVVVSVEVDDDFSDFLLCGLVTALDSIDAISFKSSNLPSTPLRSTFMALTLDLFLVCDKVAASPGSESSKFCKEWNEFFLPTLSRMIVRLFTLLKADSDCKPSIRSLCLAVQSISAVPEDLGLQETYLPELDTLRYEPGVQTLISSTVHLLQSHEHVIAFSGLHLFKMIAALMYRQENAEWCDDDGGLSKEPRKAKPPFVLNRLIVERLGFSSLMAYDAAFEPFKCITNEEERVSYCNALGLYFDVIIDRLLAECEPLDNMGKSRYSDFFTDKSFALSDCASDEEFRIRYACSIFYKMVISVPAVFRSWYNGLRTSNTTAIMKLVPQYCSHKIIQTELSKVKEANVIRKAEKDKSLKVVVVPYAREVVAEYIVEETTMRLTIALPLEYPLVVPKIELDKSVVPSEKTEKWKRQLTAYLFHQNGSIMDGILMWRKNVDKDVDGAEACCICMMTIDSNTHQLPRVRCKQCKNKFHAHCLYKWFESSNQSSCPLCRSNFT